MRLPRWLRPRRRQPPLPPITVPFADPYPLGEEVIRHLFATMDMTPAAERRASCWVMSTEWFNEVRRVADSMGRTAYAPPPGLGCVEQLLGLPIEVRDGGGVPHLEPR